MFLYLTNLSFHYGIKEHLSKCVSKEFHTIWGRHDIMCRSRVQQSSNGCFLSYLGHQIQVLHFLFLHAFMQHLTSWTKTDFYFVNLSYLNYGWLRMTTIKEGEVIRSPALGFGDGFHIQFSAKHGWFIELNTGSLHLLYPKKQKKMIPSKKNHRFQVVLNVNKVDDVGHTLSFTHTK